MAHGTPDSSVRFSPLDRIDNDLRPRRNEMIHAHWQSPKGRLQKITHRTKIIRPQSFQRILETEQRIPAKVSDLRKLRLDLIHAWAGVLFATMFAVRSSRVGGQQPLPSKLTRRYFRRAGLGILPKDAHSKQQPQPKPSPATVQKHHSRLR
jgi:hypothetical protein